MNRKEFRRIYTIPARATLKAKGRSILILDDLNDALFMGGGGWVQAKFNSRHDLVYLLNSLQHHRLSNRRDLHRKVMLELRKMRVKLASNC